MKYNSVDDILKNLPDDGFYKEWCKYRRKRFLSKWFFILRHRIKNRILKMNVLQTIFWTVAAQAVALFLIFKIMGAL